MVKVTADRGNELPSFNFYERRKTIQSLCRLHFWKVAADNGDCEPKSLIFEARTHFVLLFIMAFISFGDYNRTPHIRLLKVRNSIDIRLLIYRYGSWATKASCRGLRPKLLIWPYILSRN